MLAKAYAQKMKARARQPYKIGRGKQQKALTKWAREDWQTSKGNKVARRKDGTMARYLPKATWAKMSAKAKRKTNTKKIKGSRKGKQRVKR